MMAKAHKKAEKPKYIMLRYSGGKLSRGRSNVIHLIRIISLWNDSYA